MEQTTQCPHGTHMDTLPLHTIMKPGAGMPYRPSQRYEPCYSQSWIPITAEGWFSQDSGDKNRNSLKLLQIKENLLDPSVACATVPHGVWEVAGQLPSPLHSPWPHSLLSWILSALLFWSPLCTQLSLLSCKFSLNVAWCTMVLTDPSLTRQYSFNTAPILQTTLPVLVS